MKNHYLLKHYLTLQNSDKAMIVQSKDVTKRNRKRKRFLTPFQRLKLKWSKKLEKELSRSFEAKSKRQPYVVYILWVDKNYIQLDDHLVKVVMQFILILIIFIVLYIFNKI